MCVREKAAKIDRFGQMYLSAGMRNLLEMHAVYASPSASHQLSLSTDSKWCSKCKRRKPLSDFRKKNKTCNRCLDRDKMATIKRKEQNELKACLKALARNRQDNFEKVFNILTSKNNCILSIDSLLKVCKHIMLLFLLFLFLKVFEGFGVCCEGIIIFIKQDRRLKILRFFFVGPEGEGRKVLCRWKFVV